MAIGGCVPEPEAAVLARAQREDRKARRAELRLGPVLKRAREQAKLGLREVQRRTGVSPAFLSLLERGEREGVGIVYLSRLCACYGIKLDDLVREALDGEPASEWERAFERFCGDWGPEVSTVVFRRDLVNLLHLVRQDERGQLP